MSRREAAKDERRRKIIEAARFLIRETGDARLSMRALAVRAGVSLPTPYNLFGSKRAIVWAVLEDVEAFDREFAARRPSGAIEQVFEVLEMMTAHYVAEPAFYRTLWLSLFDAGAPDIRVEFEARRRAMFRYLVQQAADEGLLEPSTNLDLLAMQMEQVLFGAIVAWLFDYMRAKHLPAMVGHGAALILTGVVAEAHRGGLLSQRLVYQEQLVATGLAADARNAVRHIGLDQLTPPDGSRPPSS